MGSHSISFDRLAGIYDDTRGGLPRGRLIAADIAPLIGPGSVLEVGVGTGAVSVGLTELGRPAVGIDLSMAMLVRAHERLGSVVAVGDAARLPVGDARVDTLLFVWVLQLVGDLDEVVGEAARVIRPAGRIVVVVGPGRARPDDEIEPFVNQLFGSFRRPGSRRDGVLEAAAAVGLQLAAEGLTTELVWEQTLNEEADHIEGRRRGFLLDWDDETFERLARPVIDGLRNLPEPDRPRVRGARHTYLVLERTDESVP